MSDLNRSHHDSIYDPYQHIEKELSSGQGQLCDMLKTIDGAGYFYFAETLRTRVDILRQALPQGIHLHYAVKANPNKEVVKFLSPLVDGFDIASGGELERLLGLGIEGKQISFAGPGKKASEIKLAVKNGVKLVCESMQQLKLAAEAAKEFNTIAKCMIRLNDTRHKAAGGLSMAGSGAAFGIDIDEFETTIHDFLIENPFVEFEGLHIFKGSQNLNATKLGQSIRETKELICDLKLPSLPRNINIGGGLGIPYTPKDVPLNLTEITPIWEDLYETLNHKFPDSYINVELGRFIVGPTGLYITEIIDKKMIGDHTYLICNGGMHHFSAATGNFGQVIKQNHPVWAFPVAKNNHRSNTAPPESDMLIPLEELEKVTISGCLCTPMDVFAKDIELPKCEIGDYLVLYQAGAYGYTASPINFLSHDHAKEFFIEE